MSKVGDMCQEKSTYINIVTGLFTMIAQTLINFFLSPYIVRTLGEEANGFTQLANNFVSYATLLTLAFNSMAGRFVSVSYHKGDKKKVLEYYSSVIICDICIGIILLIAGFFVIWKLEYLISLGSSDALDVKILFSCVFANYFFSQFASIYNMSLFVKDKIYLTNVINLARNILYAILLIVVFGIFPPRMYYVSAIVTGITICTVPIYYIIKNKDLPELKFKKNTFNIGSVLELFKSGIWNTVNQGGNMLMTGMDLLMANLFINAESMGVLSVSKIVPNAIVALVSVLNTSFAPSITINWAMNNKKEIIDELNYSVKVSSIIISIPVVTFCMFANSFYRLWQPTLDSQQLAILSFLTMMSLIPLSGSQIINNIFTATNRLKLNSLTFFAGGILNVVIVFVLLKYTNSGIYAVAGVSSIVTVIRTVFFVLPYAAYILELKWYYFFKSISISVLVAGVNFVVAVGVNKILSINSWTVLAAAVLLTSIITLVVDILIIANKDERKKILYKLKK